MAGVSQHIYIKEKNVRSVDLAITAQVAYRLAPTLTGVIIELTKHRIRIHWSDGLTRSLHYTDLPDLQLLKETPYR